MPGYNRPLWRYFVELGSVQPSMKVLMITPREEGLIWACVAHGCKRSFNPRAIAGFVGRGRRIVAGQTPIFNRDHFDRHREHAKQRVQMMLDEARCDYLLAERSV